MRENTPEFALKVEECLVEYKEGANRWTDNIFNIISWVSGLYFCQKIFFTSGKKEISTS